MTHQIFKFLEVSILSDDLAATRIFYERLGMRIIESSTTELKVSCGTTVLVFTSSGGVHPVYHIAFDVAWQMFDKALSELKAVVDIIPADGQNLVADFRNWNAKSFYFCDNNGNIIEYIAREDVSGSMQAGKTEVLHVSEVGIVTQDVFETASQIEELHNIPVFFRQPRGEHFTVMGSDFGLLIVVSEGRNWYPTNIMAKKFLVKILIERAEGEIEELNF